MTDPAISDRIISDLIGALLFSLQFRCTLRLPVNPTANMLLHEKSGNIWD
jgi:hypothetical protein